MVDISTKLKERFCKDCNFSIRLFKEPYFTDRLKLYDNLYNTLDKWEIFVKELEKYSCEQDYLEEYNKVKDNAINSIKNTDAYNRFNSEDMNKYSVRVSIPNKDIYKAMNDKREFISIDIVKANFSCLSYYDYSIFSADTWEDFISKFTNNKHIIHSKYIRQVILGNCNPKRQVTFEKYLMKEVLYSIKEIDRVVFFSNDEIVLDITDMGDTEDKDSYLYKLEKKMKEQIIPLKVERFTLHKIEGTEGYYKKLYNGGINIKCANSFTLPFVLRKLQGEEITESDKVFYHEGMLSKFIEVPNIEI